MPQINNSSSLVRLGWGVNSHGRMQHISEVSRGKACNCICSDCGIALKAKQGKKYRWHFAHAASVECTGESALHKAAKQILVECANNSEKILLPVDEGVVKLKDILEIEHTLSWGANSIFFEMVSGDDEVTLRNDLRVDVLVDGAQNNSNLAVEVFVTNKKDDVDVSKFIDLQQYSIEVDISGLDWSADKEAIRNAMLSDAPRKWLYREDEKYLEQKTIEELKANVAEVNNSYHNSLDSLISRIKENGSLSYLRLDWPKLSALSYGENAFDTNVSEYQNETPKVSKLNDCWERVHGGWKTNGIAGSKTEVDVYFWIEGVNTKYINVDRPTLLLQIDVINDVTIDHMKITWLGHEHWIQELERRTKEKLKEKIYNDTVKKENVDNFAENFKSSSNKEKLKMISRKLNLPCPSWVGGGAPAWNTTWSVWKALVWHYSLQKNDGGSVNIQAIAKDKWLKQLLGWPDTDVLEEKRRKDLWCWFIKLQKEEGFISYSGDQWFSIMDDLPKDFEPWEWLSK